MVYLGVNPSHPRVPQLCSSRFDSPLRALSMGSRSLQHILHFKKQLILRCLQLRGCQNQNCAALVLVMNKLCPFAQRAWLALEESGMSYKLHEVGLGDGVSSF